MMRLRIAVLMTCHNRKSVTVECLHRFEEACLPCPQIKVDLWINDDGSTDGTSDAVRQWFGSRTSRSPSLNLHIIRGSGSDFWCGGMRRAWQAAIDAGIDYDGYLWLNDDTWLYKDGLRILVDDEQGSLLNEIRVGAIASRDGKSVTYGGEDERGFVRPSGLWQPLRQMNGNCVWVPKCVFTAIGNFDPKWTHAFGDGDYSRLANERGIPVRLTPSCIGSCDRNAKLPPWQRPDVPMMKRISNLYSPLGYAEPLLMFRYCLKHDGLGVAIKNFFSAHLQALFPKGQGK